MFRILLLTIVLPGVLTAQTPTGATRATARSHQPIVQPGAGDAPARMIPTTLDDMPGPTVQLRDAMPSSVTVTWNPLAGVSGFLVYRNDVGQVTPNPLPPGATSLPLRRRTTTG